MATRRRFVAVLDFFFWHSLQASDGAVCFLCQFMHFKWSLLQVFGFESWKKHIFFSLKLLHIIFTSFHLNSKRRQFRPLFYSLSIFFNLKQKQHAEADIQKMKSNIACIANQRLCKILSNEKQF